MSEIINDEVSKGVIGHLFNSALSKVQLSTPDHLQYQYEKDDYLSSQKRMMQTDFLSKFTAKSNGTDIAYYKDGEILTDPQTAKLLPLEDVIKKHYSNYILPEKVDKPGSAVESFLKTKVDVIKHLQKIYESKGIKKGHPKFNEDYQRILRQQNIQ